MRGVEGRSVRVAPASSPACAQPRRSYAAPRRLVRVGRGEAIEWGRRFRDGGAIDLVHLDQPTEERAWEILEGHDDKRWSYVDATSFALLERDGGEEAFAFDIHFSQRGLRVLPGV